MGWEIEFKDKEGNIRTHKNNNSEGDARGWADVLKKDGGYSKLTHVADGPYDRSGKRTTIVTNGEK